ncbi:MAG: TonB-dependent receptor [Pseudomonadota bacterium]
MRFGWGRVVAAASLLALCPLTAFDNAKAQETRQEINIAAGELSQAILSVSDMFGVPVIASNDLLSGRQAPAVSGVFSAREAVARLLQGSEIVVERSPEGALFLSQASGEETLPPTNEAGDGVLMIDEILVRGELQTRTLQETQTSVTIVTGQELEQRGDIDLNSLAERTVNLTATSNNDFSIRGIDSGGVDGNLSAPLVTVTIDGARISNFLQRRDATLFSTWDLEQVEILRGPQSTQQGRNALAGAVIYRSADPSYEQEIKVHAGAGNGGLAQGAFALNLPLVDEKLALRFSGEGLHSDGFVDNPILGIDDQDREERLTLRGGLRFDPTESFSGILKLNFVDLEAGSENLDGTFFPDDRFILLNEIEEVDRQLRSANLRLNYSLNDAWAIESETTLLSTDYQEIFDGDSSPAPIGIQTARQDGESVEQEIKVSYESDVARAVVGAFYTKIDQDFRLGSSLPAAALGLPGAGAGDIATVSARFDNTTTNFALFGEAELPVYGDLRLVIGGRYDRERIESGITAAITTSNPALPVPPLTSEQGDVIFDAFLPKAGLIYDLTNDVSLSFTYQQGYRAGGSDLNLNRGAVVDFDPEFTNNFELAFRSEWMNGDLTANANMFYTRWKDQQVNVLGPSGNPFDAQTENAGRSRIFGAELDIRAFPLEDLEIFGSLGFTDTKFTDFNLDGVQLAGNEFVNAPNVTASFGGVYWLTDTIFFGADASFTAASFSDVQNTLENDSRFLVNARLGYESDDWSVFGYVDNLTDQDYVTGNFAGNTIRAGDPLTFGLIGQINF